MPLWGLRPLCGASLADGGIKVTYDKGYNTRMAGGVGLFHTYAADGFGIRLFRRNVVFCVVRPASACRHVRRGSLAVVPRPHHVSAPRAVSCCYGGRGAVCCAALCLTDKNKSCKAFDFNYPARAAGDNLFDCFDYIKEKQIPEQPDAVPGFVFLLILFFRTSAYRRRPRALIIAR